MAGDKVNNYAQDDTNILELQLTTDKTFKGYHQLTLTEYDTTTVPAIAAGSAIECNGALYKFDSEEAISTTDPVTSATVADGTVYVCIVPGATTCTAAFTATAPTWSDSKQGWYGTGGQANYRYAEYKMLKAATTYSRKRTIHYEDSNIDSIGLDADGFRVYSKYFTGSCGASGGTGPVSITHGISGTILMVIAYAASSVSPSTFVSTPISTYSISLTSTTITFNTGYDGGTYQCIVLYYA